MLMERMCRMIERMGMGTLGCAGWTSLVAGPASLSVMLWSFSLADGSAIFRGCFRQPDNVSIALPVSQLMLNMSVDKCVDFCTEKVPRVQVKSSII